MTEEPNATDSEPSPSFEEQARETSLYAFLPELRGLDMLLGRAVDATQATYGTKNGTDPFRGLYISPLEAAQLLAREPGIPFLRSVSNSTPGQTPGAISERLDWIARVYGLTVFDVDVMVLSLAPELDLRYERLYAYLQDDVTRRRPSVDLALNLLSPSAEAKLAHRMRFAPGAALIDHDLVHLIPDSNQTQPSLLSHYRKRPPRTVSTG